MQLMIGMTEANVIAPYKEAKHIIIDKSERVWLHLSGWFPTGETAKANASDD
jgi:hypothetical protein